MCNFDVHAIVIECNIFQGWTIDLKLREMHEIQCRLSFPSLYQAPQFQKFRRRCFRDLLSSIAAVSYMQVCDHQPHKLICEVWKSIVMFIHVSS